MSSSWRSSARPHTLHAAGRSRATVTWPVRRSTRPGCGGPTTAGARCTSPGCSSSSACTSSVHSSGTNLVLPCSHGGERLVGERLGLDPPLLHQHRLDHRARALAAAARHLVWLDLAEQPAGLEVRDHRLARLVHRHADVLRGRRRASCVPCAIDDLEDRRGRGAGRPRSRSDRARASPSPRRSRTPDPATACRLERCRSPRSGCARPVSGSSTSLAAQRRGSARRSGAPRPRCRRAWSPAAWSRR